MTDQEKRNGDYHIIAKKLYPNQSQCSKCQLPWGAAGKSHNIQVTNILGMFAICEYCWQHSTEDERLTF